jgi:uncharacterized membrane protein
MAFLVLGLVLFLGMHSVSIVAQAWRDRTAARLGNGWSGLHIGFSRVRPVDPTRVV